VHLQTLKNSCFVFSHSVCALNRLTREVEQFVLSIAAGAASDVCILCAVVSKHAKVRMFNYRFVCGHSF
jgi:hypothetical protein